MRAASVMPDTDEPTRQAINKLDGVSVHVLRFGDTGVPDEDAVNSIREAYHLRGWKHVVTTQGNGGPVHNGTTDVWMVMDGVNVRGAVVLAETPKIPDAGDGGRQSEPRRHPASARPLRHSAVR